MTQLSEPPVRDLWDQAATSFAAHRAGDAGALDRLVQLLTPVLWQVVRSYRLDAATAEDVVQTTWLALVRHEEAIGDPQAVGRWLTVTARREAWRCVRAEVRVRVVDDDGLELRPASGESPEGVAVRSARDSALWAALHTLPERCQRLLRIVAFTDRPNYQQVSAELGMPVGSIGPTRARCLDRLREHLDDADWRLA